MKTKISLLLAVILAAAVIATGCGSQSAQPENSEETVIPTVAETEAAAEPETEPETEGVQEYYAIDLVNKPLSEIIDIMGGDFEVEINGKRSLVYTSDCVCFYNDEKLPGFAFFVDASAASGEASIKQGILNGEFDHFAFMGVYENAKYDENISADMTYLEVSEAIGSYELAPVVGSAIPRQTIDSRATVWYDAGEMSEAAARSANPSIKGISVSPNK